MRKITAHELKHRPGTWQAKGQDPDTLQRRSFYGNSKEEAERKARESYKPELSVEDQATVYGFYSRVYLPTILHRSPNWNKQVGHAMDKHFLPKIGHLELTAVTRPMLQEIFNEMTALSVKSRQLYKIVLNCVFNLALIDGKIPSNPCAFVRLPQPTPSRKRALSFEELHQLIEHSHTLIKPVVLLAGCCGLRRGEFLGLTKANISADNILSVDQQIRYDGNKMERTSTLKTPNSRRAFPIPAALADRLRAGDSMHVCPDSIGGVLRPGNVSRELAIACKRAGIETVTAHELRHTFISLMENELEAPRRVAQSIAGHKGREVTDIYSHTQRTQMLKWMTIYWERASTEKCPTICPTAPNLLASN